MIRMLLSNQLYRAGLGARAHRPVRELSVSVKAVNSGSPQRSYGTPQSSNSYGSSYGNANTNNRAGYGSANNSKSIADESQPGRTNYRNPDPTRPASAQTQPPQNVDMSKRMAELQDLLQETVKVVMSTGPKGVVRAMQAAEAGASVMRDFLLGGASDPPHVILRKLFERLGSTYIKLGQFIASSPSLFPDEYVLEFQKCLDKTEPVGWPPIKAIIERELGRPISDVFVSIDPNPLASASVAQVHAAVLKGSNKDVVIKVLKPGVEDVLTADMSAVYLLSRYLEFLQPDLNRLSLTAIIGDIRASMLDEVDFTKEAEHAAHFSAFLDERGFRNVATCPFVYKQFSSKRILVMERLQGVPLVDYSAIRSITTKEPEAVLVAALNTWFASVLGAQTFHADVHAGNLLVLGDGRVGFLDFGIVGRISPVTWRAVEALVASLATGDYETMARALATIGACDADVDYDKFARDLESFFIELEQVNTNLVVSRDRLGGAGFAASLEVDQTQLNRLFLNLVRIGESHGVRFPREFGLFLKQLLYFDRYTRILAPSLQMFNDDRINIKDLSRQYGM
uniref:ABC1 atypical kinase-like domain-containing protein n=1 Tax=Chlamydomonas leiostraca TaxID=1034604 RepID=A0A7S0X116_9CHLO